MLNVTINLSVIKKYEAMLAASPKKLADFKRLNPARQDQAIFIIKTFEQVQKAPRADAVALLFGPGAYQENQAAIDALLA